MPASRPPVSPPEPLLRMARGFMEARVLLTAAELDLFTQLAAEPRSASALAREHGWQLRPLTTVLDTLAAMELLRKKAGVYRCPPEMAGRLASGGPDSILASILHTADLWERWSGLTARVKGGRSGPPTRPDYTRAFIGAMDVIARSLAPRIVAAVKPAGARRLLDVGGASGTYTLAFLQAAPEMRATLFDLPDVIPLARERLAAAGCLERVTLAAGDYLTDPLPGGHDLAWLSAIIHANGPEENLALFRKVWAALSPGGRLIIRDHVMDDERTAPRAGALFAVNMLVATRAGGTYTFAEIADGLANAGFREVRLLQAGEMMDALVEARRPA